MGQSTIHIQIVLFYGELQPVDIIDCHFWRMYNDGALFKRIGMWFRRELCILYSHCFLPVDFAVVYCGYDEGIVFLCYKYRNRKKGYSWYFWYNLKTFSSSVSFTYFKAYAYNDGSVWSLLTVMVRIIRFWIFVRWLHSYPDVSNPLTVYLLFCLM